jgi:outer membrane cobalamin receptor
LKLLQESKHGTVQVQIRLLKFTRKFRKIITVNNLGGYFDLAYDVTEDFLINGTVRYEDYSDFGGFTVWKEFKI